jgi:hypothetical protein
MPYHLPRQVSPKATGQPLELDLVYNVRPCGTCNFFWPDDPAQQPYGPYPSFDLNLKDSIPPDPADNTRSFPWIKTSTAAPAFPDPEIMDGCRKAPIMTIGINPNLTAFAPGSLGAEWAYPQFVTDQLHDEWTKYAYYFRYRSVYQERFAADFIERFLLREPRVVASRAGAIVSAERTSSSPSFVLKVRYDGDLADTAIPLEGKTGAPRWVVLVDPHPPSNRFSQGDTLAARLDVPASEAVQVYRGQVGYYEQFVPALNLLETALRAKGHTDVALRMGEDVCQLDMVGCASPHWTPDFLGGSSQSERTIIDNCVSKNAWVMKQLVQTRPAVLFLVGEATYDMFRGSFGRWIERTPPLSPKPADGAFTLLAESTDANHACYFRFEKTLDGTTYQLQTRLVITPHFSYSTNFMPQFRLNPTQWKQLRDTQPALAATLEHDPRVTYVPPVKETDYVGFLIKSDKAGLVSDLQKAAPSVAKLLGANFLDPHQMMADVLIDLLAHGVLRYGPIANGHAKALTRTEGACCFCVNDHWKFPEGCPYDKPDEPAPATGFLEKIAAAIVASGKP